MKMKIVIGSVLTVAVLVFSISGSTAGTQSAPADAMSTDDAATVDVLALAADEQSKQEQLDVLLAPIQSAAGLQAYLDSRHQDSPLDRLSPAALQRFLDSLTFNDSGLTGYRTDDLQEELTATQAYRILELFGAQHTTPMLRGLTIKTKLDARIMAMDPAAKLMMSDHEGYR